MKKNVAIIGHGVVGKAMNLIFPDALVYDVFKDYSASKEKINEECGLAVICLPTPPKGSKEQHVDENETNFLEADLTLIEEAVEWLETDFILIKSTIPPGTTDMLKKKYGKRVCFSAEYIGESSYYTPDKYLDPKDPRKHNFMNIGGSEDDCNGILDYFIEKLGPTKNYMIMKAVEVECIKYLENTFGAMKVTFFNTWYDICELFGANYNKVREGFLLDPRTGPMHTSVFKEKRGFGGHCFPKDLLAIINACESKGYNPRILKEIWETNKIMLGKNKKEDD